MAPKTPYADLYKWDKTDSKLVTIQGSADNAEKIDTKLKSHNDSITAVEGRVTTVEGKVTTVDKRVDDVNTDITTKVKPDITSVKNQLDSIIIASGTSDAETVQARGTFPILKDRLNSVDEQLASITQQIGRGTLTINLPSKIYALVGQELNIYFDNIIEGKDTDYIFDVTCSIGSQYNNYYRVSPTTPGSYSLTIDVYQHDAKVASATTTIIVADTNAGNGLPRNLLIIGDSTTDNSYLVAKIQDDFSADVMDIITIGTRGTSPNNHEGHSGWSTSNFMSSGSPFWYNGAFNFSQYITSHSLPTPDYVLINLGINDTFYATDDNSLNPIISSIVSYYNTMIASIKLQNSVVKIGVCLTIPPNYSQDSFGAPYKSDQTRNRYKRNNILLVNQLIQSFGNRESENIYLIPIHVNLDTRYNFGMSTSQVNARNTKTIDFPANNAYGQTPGVHPSDSGYWQNADSYWYFIKNNIDTSLPDRTPPIVTASPAAGSYSGTQSITLTANEPATIYYTTDGTTPTTSSNVYNAPISISATTTLKYFGIDTTGNQSAAQTSTYTFVTFTVHDSFNRADATSLGNADTGQAWTVLKGGYGISNNRAYPTQSLSESIAVVDSGVADCNVEVTFVVANQALRLAFRATDMNNFWIITSTTTDYQLYKYVNGSFTKVGSTVAQVPVNGDVLKVALSGSSIQFFINGISKLSVTDSFNSLATKHGIASSQDATITNGRFDEFKVY